MSGAATFLQTPYELAAKGATVVVAPLPPDDGQRLGTAFAAINPWAAYGYSGTVLARFLAASEPAALRFGLSIDNVLAGAAVVRPHWLRGPYLQFLGVLPDAQGRGIGAAFLTWMEREARAANERNLWVAASQINTGAVRFYERHGFTEVATLDDLVADGFNEILLRKRLS
jgi:GNAT superfamily N-acetyltransferase